MSRSERSSITRLLRRLHRAGQESDRSGIPFGDAFHATRSPTISRRTALGAAGAVGLGALIRPGVADGVKPTPPTVAIVGGGAAGLACAHRLDHFHIPSTVFEAQGRLGGHVYTSRGFFDGGAVVERGGEFLSSEHRHVRRLAASMGLELEQVNGGGFVDGGEEVYFVDGQYYTEADAQADWFEGKVWKKFASAIKDAPYPPRYDSFTPEHSRLDHLNVPDWLDEVGIGSTTPLGRLLQTDAIVEYGPNADEQTCLNLLYTVGYNGPHIDPLAGTDERFHIVGGNDQLIERVADSLPPGSIERSRPLISIHGPAEGPYTLVFDSGPDFGCDVLVLALPFTTLREVTIDDRIWSAFGPAKRLAIENLALGPNGKVHIQTTSRPWARAIAVGGGEAIIGNGVSYSDPDRYICSWDATAASGDYTPVLVNFLGGTLGEGAGQPGPFGPATLPDVVRVLAELDAVFPGTADAYAGKALASYWRLHPWSKGAYFSPTIGDYTSFFGAAGEQEKNIFFCGEHTEIDAFGFIEGAVRTGELVAQEIHRQY